MHTLTSLCHGYYLSTISRDNYAYETICRKQTPILTICVCMCARSPLCIWILYTYAYTLLDSSLFFLPSLSFPLRISFNKKKNLNTTSLIFSSLAGGHTDTYPHICLLQQKPKNMDSFDKSVSNGSFYINQGQSLTTFPSK